MKPIDDLSDDEFAQVLRRAVALDDVPPALTRAAIGLWPVQVASPLLRRVAALLSFDSWSAAPLAAGMRSAATPGRQLLFSAVDHDVDLRLTASAGRFTLTGQVLGPDGAGVVELFNAGDADVDAAAPLRATPLDDLGGFRIDQVERGRYVLRLRSGAADIVLPAIDVAERER